jgi:GH24 family phage-related lysozyme (muramidase)
MDYQKAKDIRKQGLANLITENLVSGQGIGSSLGSALSDRTKATFTGIKESFDPMNVAKKLTGGSKLASALVGRMTGRSQDDMAYFTGKPKKSGFLGMIGLGGKQNDSSMADVLGLIYREMLRAEEDKKLFKEEEENKQEGRELEEDRRNKEIIEALTGKKYTAPKAKSDKKKKEKPYRDEKGRFAKKPKTAEITKTKTKKTAEKKTGLSILGKLFTPTGAGIGAAVVGGVLVGKASDVIAKEEGVSTKGYWDPPDQREKVSIGYGHQITPQEYSQGFIQAGNEQVPLKGERGIDTVVTKEQAKKLFEVDLPKYEKKAADPLGASWNKLNDNQKTALVSYAYNVGSTQNLVNAGLKSAIDSGDTKTAANIIREKGIKTAGGKYNKVLDERRHREAALFETVTEAPKASNVPPETKTGDRVDSSSKENKDLKTPPKDTPAPVSVNTTNVNQLNKSTSTDTQPTEDDRPAPLRKRRG